MPIILFQANSRGSLNIKDLLDLSEAFPIAFPVLEYRFAYWYPRITLTNIPINTSQALNSFGNKFYLGQVAFLNHGFINSVEYLAYRQQQFTPKAALPVPIFQNPEDATGFLFNGSLFSGVERATEIAWDLRDGVSFQLEILYLLGNLRYGDGITQLQVI